MLVVYFDARRTEKGRPYMAVAGCLAYLDNRKSFNLSGSEVIIQRTDFALGRGVAYDDWEYAQRKNEVLARWSPFTIASISAFTLLRHKRMKTIIKGLLFTSLNLAMDSMQSY